MKSSTITVLLFLFISSFIYAQQSCKVLHTDINEEYIGECKKNLAHGQGTAKGLNTYKGEFKNGYPHGHGVMIYQDGSTYTGQWKKGERNGEGTLVSIVQGKDSIANGIWKNNEYLGKKVVNPYEVTRKTSVQRYIIRKASDDVNKVTITIKNGGNSFPVPRNILSSSGTLNILMGRAVFENITTYPFECEMRYSVPTKFGGSNYDAEFNFKIFEKGNWVVEIYH